MTDLTITVPTGKVGELAYFKIEFPESKFNEVIEMVGLLVKPSDVALAEEMGMWKIV